MLRNGRAEDVLDLLMQEHRELEALLTDLRYAGTARQRREDADQLIASLVRHSLVEEAFVVPLVRDYLIHGEESVAHDRQEHDELELLLRELESLDGADPRFMEVVLDLQATLAHHIALEEGQQFPQVRLAAPVGELVALRERVRTVERAAPGVRAEAEDAEADRGVVVVDPGAGVVDRLRDALARLQAS